MTTGARFAADLRVPALDPASYTGTFNRGGGDLVANCLHAGCGWTAYGPRPEVKAAFDVHIRLQHGGRAGGMRLNHPGQ